jgi:DNA segregation ATPase FtsK/SpoIIIE-like protein
MNPVAQKKRSRRVRKTMQSKEFRRHLLNAKRIVLSTRNTSISHLQRKMGIGYNSATQLMEEISKLRSFRRYFVEKKSLKSLQRK